MEYPHNYIEAYVIILVRLFNEIHRRNVNTHYYNKGAKKINDILHRIKMILI